jgi:hypothetical protein
MCYKLVLRETLHRTDEHLWESVQMRKADDAGVTQAAPTRA